MGESGLAGSGVLVAAVISVAMVLFLAGAMRISARRGVGLFHYFPYALLFSLAVSVFLSGRILSDAWELLSEVQVDTNPVSLWITRLVSVLVVLASVERIGSYILQRHRIGTAPQWLLGAFVVFWVTNVASPVLLAAEGVPAHDYVYTLLMGCAAVLLSKRESDLTVAAARNALLIFLAVSVALIPLRPSLVLDWNYTEGFLPGVPRFAGLAMHSVTLGMLAQLALLCVYAEPLPRRWLNHLCWALGLLTLFLAQSKTSWLSFPVCMAAMLWVRDAPAPREPGNARQKRFSRYIPLALLVVAVGIGVAFIFGNLSSGLASFLATNRGAEVASLSGRDQIWNVALEEWARHPVFGYGSSLFDEVYRTGIGMPFAVNGHDQFIDTLARSGLVGVAGLLFYASVLLVFSVRCARGTNGLSIAIFLAILFQSVSEVPLAVFQYGTDVMQQLLLLAILAGYARARSVHAASHVGASDLRLYYKGDFSRAALDG